MPKVTQATTPKNIGTGFSSGALFMLKAVFVSYCLSVALLFLVAILATFKSFSDNAISIAVNIVTTFGVAFCGFVSGRHFESKGIVFGAICGTVYAVLLCLIGNLAAQTFQVTSGALTALAIGVICGAVGGIVGINTKKQKRR